MSDLTMTEAHEVFMAAGNQWSDAAYRELIAKVTVHAPPNVAQLEVTAICEEGYSDHSIRLLDADGHTIDMTEDLEAVLMEDTDWYLTVTEGVTWPDTTARLIMPELRSCDTCGKVTDAGEAPDWPNGICPDCPDH